MKTQMNTQNAGKFMMLEKGNHRFEFYTRAVRVSNVDNRIAYYEPIIRHCEKLTNGSTYNETHVSVECGNKFYKELILDGYKRVAERTFA